MTDQLDPLIAAARRGDAQAFGALVEACQAGVRGYLAVRLGDRHAADDLAQNAFLVAYRRLGDFRDGESFRAWLRGIAHNLLRNHLRGIARARSAPLPALAVVDDQAARFAERDGEEVLLARLRACLERLPAEQRRLVDARYVDERSIEDLCRAAGATRSAMSMALHRARARLRACVGGDAAAGTPA